MHIICLYQYYDEMPLIETKLNETIYTETLYNANLLTVDLGLQISKGRI